MGFSSYDWGRLIDPKDKWDVYAVMFLVTAGALGVMLALKVWG